MAFICGSTGTQEDDFEVLWPSQKKTTARRHSFCSRSNKDNKNPYSNRGLDKFEALLADLDGKRQKIFTQKGSEDISFVRFVYSNSNDVKPIVVKIKDQRKLDQKDHNLNNVENHKTSDQLSSPRPTNNNKSGTVEEVAKPSIDLCKKKDHLRRKIVDWWKPWYCLPLFVILILVFLVFFGRSFAILCTSLGWYLVPATSELNPKRQKKIVKKDNARKSSEKTIMSPRSVLNSEPMNNQPHRKSF